MKEVNENGAAQNENFLLFTILLSNLIAPQVQAVQATSTDETKVTTATSDEGNHEFSTSQNEIIDSAEKAISTEETKETAVGEKEPTEVTTQTENKVQEKTTSSSEQVEKEQMRLQDWQQTKQK